MRSVGGIIVMDCVSLTPVKFRADELDRGYRYVLGTKGPCITVQPGNRPSIGTDVAVSASGHNQACVWLRQRAA